MAGLEGVIRPFMGNEVGPQPFRPDNSKSPPPVHIQVGGNGSVKVMATSASASQATYLAAVHSEAPSDAFDMTSGTLA